ncbi:MAG: flagellar basal body P-ring protein FlgI [Helicobacteraceae bacterium]|nr:flagellar basal body P-ring protein FlgI [Helicobacteraceae bacterium]
MLVDSGVFQIPFLSRENGVDRFESAIWWVIFTMFLFVGVNSLCAAPLTVDTAENGTKIKDLTSIVGVRDNQLMGYGIVVGLNGTGDGTTGAMTTQTIANLLSSVNIKVSQADINSKNVAAVMVTARLAPFARQGDKTSVELGSIGDAKSLRGGTLLMTALKGADGNIYAVAQGAVSTVGGGAAANSGIIENGAIVEQEARFNLADRDSAILSLKEENLDHAVLIQNAINARFAEVFLQEAQQKARQNNMGAIQKRQQIEPDRAAFAQDSRSINLKRPKSMSMVEFLSIVNNIEIATTQPSRITIDEKSGTIVAGMNIRVRPVVVTHNAMTLNIDQSLAPEGSPLTVSSVAGALQQIGATASDLIAIMRALKRSGAIEAELVIN